VKFVSVPCLLSACFLSPGRCRDVCNWRIPLKKSVVQRYGPVSRVFDGPSETTILQRVPRLGPGYAAIISIRALAGLNLASRRKFCAVAARRNSSLAPHGPGRAKKSLGQKSDRQMSVPISVLSERKDGLQLLERPRLTLQGTACRRRGAFCLIHVPQPFFGIRLCKIAECNYFAGNNIDHREVRE
jgi:hypothetical protein